MDLKAIALSGFKNAAHLITRDLEALPEEAFTQCFGGTARTVADLVYEVNLVNERVRIELRGEEQFPWPEGWIKAPEGLDTKETVLEGFRESCQKVIATIEGLTDAEIVEKLQSDLGVKTRFERCQFMALHMWYHSGQLNFIQTLLGDDDWHWG